MFNQKSVSLVFPAFNEEENITMAIKDFQSLKIFDEIIVVDNNSTDQTNKLARNSGAKVVKETHQGYGFALRRGMNEAKGDYVVLCEPDHTFLAKDTLKLLSRIEKFDLILGTRTNGEFIEKGANMGLLLRWGNIMVAKLLQILFQTPNLSDCGCTFRVFKKSLVKQIFPFFTVGGSYFLPETVILTAFTNGSILEIPISYRKRVGTSKITGSFKRTIRVGFQMIKLIFKYRLVGKAVFKKSPEGN